MAPPTLAARGEAIRLVPSWRTGLFGVGAAREVLLPGPEGDGAARRVTRGAAGLPGQRAVRDAAGGGPHAGSSILPGDSPMLSQPRDGAL